MAEVPASGVGGLSPAKVAERRDPRDLRKRRQEASLIPHRRKKEGENVGKGRPQVSS